MESDQQGRTRFHDTIASLQAALRNEVELEFTRRHNVHLQENSRLQHENEILRHQLTATDALRRDFQFSEERCRVLDEENQKNARQLSLYKRQSKELWKVQSQLKLRAKHASVTIRNLSLALRSHQDAGPERLVRRLGNAVGPNPVSLTSIHDAALDTDGSASVVQLPASIARVASAEPARTMARASSAPPCYSCDESTSLIDKFPPGLNGGRIEAETVAWSVERGQHQVPSDAVLRKHNRKTVIECSQSTDSGASLEDELRITPIKSEPHDKSSPPTITEVRSVRPGLGRGMENVSEDAELVQRRRYDGSEQRPFVVKEERGSSPIGLAAFPSLQEPVESMDLDEIDEYVRTPHKRQRLVHHLATHLPEGVSFKQASQLGYERAMSMPSAVQAADVSPRAGSSGLDRTSGAARGYRVKREDEAAPPTNRPSKPRAAPRVPASTDQTTRILRPVSLNEQNQARVRGDGASSGRKAKNARDFMVSEVAEDGEPLLGASQLPDAVDSSVKKVETATPVERGVSGQRLRGLLETPSSQTQALLSHTRPELTARRKRKAEVGPDTTPGPATATRARQPKRQNTGAYFASTTRTSPTRRAARAASTAPRTGAGVAKEGCTGSGAESASPSPWHEPLRARPVQRLSMADFKINPDFNDGLGFAYGETVRRSADKRCRPGCMEARCCGGHFRRMAEMGVAMGAGGHGGRSLMESTPSQEEAVPEGVADRADMAMLEAHLGSGYAARQRIEKMTAAERGEAVVEAKATLLAQQHGKHRQRFARQASPDNFWDVEFPDTQQVDQCREAVRETEREKVELRYREALKGKAGKGRYLFRDE